MWTSTTHSTPFARAAAASFWWSASVLTGGFVIITCMPRSMHAIAISKCVSSGVKMIAQSPGANAGTAERNDARSTTPSAGHVAIALASMSSYTSVRLRCMCARIPGIFLPFVPHIPSRPTFPRSCRSSMHSATTPADLSESAPLPSTYPVVYSPVPSISTAGGGASVARGARAPLGPASSDACCAQPRPTPAEAAIARAPFRLR